MNNELHKPRKRFGQNFLHDMRIIQRIVSSIAPKENEPVLEIGPGQGALTAVLLPHKPQLKLTGFPFLTLLIQLETWRL